MVIRPNTFVHFVSFEIYRTSPVTEEERGAAARPLPAAVRVGEGRKSRIHLQEDNRRERVLL